MDYVHLVESGRYDPAEISDPYGKGVVAGIELARERLESFLACEYEVIDADPLHERLVASLAEEVVEGARDWLLATRAEAVVELLDEQACDAG